MIEMHLGDDPPGEDDDDYSVYPSRAGEFWRLALSAPSLAIAALVLGLAALTVVQSAEEIGETALFSSQSNHPSDLTQLRVAAAVQFAVAAVAIILAVASGLRLLSTDPDGEVSGPTWARAVAGAGFVVALVAVMVTGGSLVYSLQAHAGPLLGG
jgi:hypothetical protein